MKPLQTQEQIDEMRKRLYERGTPAGQIERHKLSDEKVDVARSWSTQGESTQSTSESSTPADSVQGESATEEAPKKRHYRGFILGGSSLIFIFVAVVSSLFIYFGGNQISNNNIQVAIQGESFIGGGEVLPLQVAISNHNSVPIESATLILQYPNGTRSVGDLPRNLFEERIPISDIDPGEVQNVPVKVAVFGEENSEKSIKATIEYRVNGSNGMFYKEADPFLFKISSSPLVLRIDNIEKVASGQIVDLTITAVSNASSPLIDILVSASYPNGFSFEKSDPEPIYGENVWHIEELLPEEEISIELQGLVTGLTEETFRINFAVGPADTDNRYLIGANLAEGKADFEIERPFIDVQIVIDDDKDREAIIPEGETSKVKVDITNTLDETVYDMVVEVVPSGNALVKDSIKSKGGFYNSNDGTVRWEVSNNKNFDKVFPGDTRNLEFSVVPGPNRTTSSYDLVVNVYARRVAETSAAETLIGTTRAEAKYSASVMLGSQASLKTGPIPPKVGETSVYTLTVVAEAGANDMVNTVVDTSLPLYVDWLDTYDADGQLTYNSVSKKIEWNVGEIPAGQRKELNFEVRITPSVSQVDSSPILLNSQTIRANDRFTGALLQDRVLPVTTKLSPEMGLDEENGTVVR